MPYITHLNNKTYNINFNKLESLKDLYANSATYYHPYPTITAVEDSQYSSNVIPGYTFEGNPIHFCYSPVLTNNSYDTYVVRGYYGTQTEFIEPLSTKTIILDDNQGSQVVYCYPTQINYLYKDKEKPTIPLDKYYTYTYFLNTSTNYTWSGTYQIEQLIAAYNSRNEKKTWAEGISDPYRPSMNTLSERVQIDPTARTVSAWYTWLYLRRINEGASVITSEDIHFYYADVSTPVTLRFRCPKEITSTHRPYCSASLMSSDIEQEDKTYKYYKCLIANSTLEFVMECNNSDLFKNWVATIEVIEGESTRYNVVAVTLNPTIYAIKSGTGWIKTAMVKVDRSSLSATAGIPQLTFN